MFSPVLSWMSEGYELRVAPCLAGPYFSDVTDVTFPTSADVDANVRLLTSADADLHNPKQNACVTFEISEICFLIFMNYIQEGWKLGIFFNLS